MSYVLPANNAIAKLTDLKQPDALRKQQFDMDQRFQLEDFRTNNEGRGPQRGAGGRSRRR